MKPYRVILIALCSLIIIASSSPMQDVDNLTKIREHHNFIDLQKGQQLYGILEIWREGEYHVTNGTGKIIIHGEVPLYVISSSKK